MDNGTRHVGIIESFIHTASEVKQGARHMHIAHITGSGQITLPKEVRRTLMLNAGDTLSFLTDANGKIVVKAAT